MHFIVGEREGRKRGRERIVNVCNTATAAAVVRKGNWMSNKILELLAAARVMNLYQALQVEALLFFRI